jgi:hypothetical protein
MFSVGGRLILIKLVFSSFSMFMLLFCCKSREQSLDKLSGPEFFWTARATKRNTSLPSGVTYVRRGT